MPETRPYPSRAEAEAAWWRAWRGCDFSWQGLARIPASNGTLQDYWRTEAGRLIAEPGSDRSWTRFHCPLVFADGSPSPKAAWSAHEWDDMRQALRTRLALGTEAAPCRLDGVVLDGLQEAEEVVPDPEAYLWLIARQAYFRGDVDLSRNGYELLDVNGAWFGGAFRTEGTHILQYNVYRSVQAMALPEQARPARPKAVQPAKAVSAVVTDANAVPATSPKPRRWPAVAGLLLAVIAILITVVILRP